MHLGLKNRIFQLTYARASEGGCANFDRLCLERNLLTRTFIVQSRISHQTLILTESHSQT